MSTRDGTLSVMRYSDRLRQLGAGVDAVIDVLEFLARLTHTAKVDEAAVVVRTVNTAILSALNGLTGNIAAEDVLAQLADLTSGLAANDAAADTELDQKFRG